MSGSETKEKTGLFSVFEATVTPRDKWDHSLEVQERVWDTIGAFTFRKTRARFGLSLTMDRPK